VKEGERTTLHTLHTLQCKSDHNTACETGSTHLAR